MLRSFARAHSEPAANPAQNPLIQEVTSDLAYATKVRLARNPETRDSNPATLQPETRIPKSEARNQIPETRNPKPVLPEISSGLIRTALHP